MSTVYITIGVPASGKSTWARENADDLNAVIVCRDDIRIMQGLKHGENEQLVTEAHRAMIEGLILEGKNVIVADTNAVKKFRNQLIKFCHQHGADVELVPFWVSLDEAILRDSNRKERVGADVVRKMYETLSGQWEELGRQSATGLPVQSYKDYSHGDRDAAIVVDIDGTVAKMNGRSPYDYSRVGEDLYIDDVCNVVNNLSYFYKLVFVSGRDDKCEDETRNWLNRRFFNYGLFMRKTGDQRPDWIIKNEIYDKHVIPKYNILMVFDDRDQVIHHLRRRGITVAQVAPGRF
jgi:predicted kinase